MTGQLLDVGCGDGSTAIENGWPQTYDYVGLDIDEERLSSARTQGLNVRNHDVTTGLDYDSETFERVICKAILEHVDDPLYVARECRRVLKPGGTITVIVPSDRSYDVWGDYTHLRAFRKDALDDLLTDAGFSSIEISPRTGWDSPGAMLKSAGRILAPWTPYGFPRAWHATARKDLDQHPVRSDGRQRVVPECRGCRTAGVTGTHKSASVIECPDCGDILYRDL